MNDSLTLKQYLEKLNISAETFADMVNKKYPHARITRAAMRSYVTPKPNNNGGKLRYRYPPPIKAYWLYKASNKEISILNLILPPERIALIEA